jgi:hypothetical protein
VPDFIPGDDPWSIEKMRLNGEEANRFAELLKPTRPPRHKPGDWFLRGPIPWPWIERAMRLPGQALALSLYLWREAGRHSQRTVKLCLARTSLNRRTAQRALQTLEKAGLVSVLRHSGQGVEMTILDVKKR